MNRLLSALTRLPRAPLVALLFGTAAAVPLVALAGGFGPAVQIPVIEAPWHQVRILERFSIRISPGAPIPPQMQMDIQQDRPGSHTEEKRIPKCVSVGQINAVQSTRDNRLVFFLRDQRVIIANLEKACRSREYYSGFYMARSADGQLCLDRDILQSRSGASCKVNRWRELVEVDDH